MSQAGYISNIVDIAIGGLTNDAMFALFVEDGGVVYGSGNNAYNQISMESGVNNYQAPIRVTDSVAQVAIGNSATSHMLKFDGSVYSQGKVQDMSTVQVKTQITLTSEPELLKWKIV